MLGSIGVKQLVLYSNGARVIESVIIAGFHLKIVPRGAKRLFFITRGGEKAVRS